MKLKPEIYREWTEREAIDNNWLPDDVYKRYVRDIEDALEKGVFGYDLPIPGYYAPGEKYYRQSPDFSEWTYETASEYPEEKSGAPVFEFISDLMPRVMADIERRLELHRALTLKEAAQK